MNEAKLWQRVRAGYHHLTKTLIARQMTITAMESATGGLIASLITDTEGSSAVLRGAFVTYSNEAKIRMGVPSGVIAAYSVYSRETAAAMAEACRKAYGADIGIGVTGTTGNPDPANPEASVPGQLFYAVSTDSGTVSRETDMPDLPSRQAYKLTAAEAVLEEVFSVLGESTEMNADAE